MCSAVDGLCSTTCLRSEDVLDPLYLGHTVPCSQHAMQAREHLCACLSVCVGVHGILRARHRESLLVGPHPLEHLVECILGVRVLMHRQSGLALVVQSICYCPSAVLCLGAKRAEYCSAFRSMH